MTKPGKPLFERLTVSLKPKAYQRLIRVKEALERESGEALTISYVVRQAVDCLADSKGVS